MKKEINYSAGFINMAKRGAEMYYMNALYWLSDALMKFYEFPKYYTVLYRASEGWGLKLRKSKHPLAFNAMCQPIMELFKYADPRYDHEYSNPLLLETMSNEEVYRLHRVRGQVPDSLLSWNCRRSATIGYPCVPLGVLAKVMRNEE